MRHCLHGRAQNYATANLLLVVMGCVASVLIALLVVFVTRRAYRRLEELEDT
ncbi:hypothetical protein [Nitrosomonas ureae]|nr:hypothetical protein [Nitrosomonas ureae]